MGRSFWRTAPIAIGMCIALLGGRAAPDTTVRIWLPGLDAHRDAIAASFQAECPGIRLQLECPPAGDLRGKLLGAAVNSTFPDLALIPYDSLGPLAEAGVCEKLDPYLDDLGEAAGLHPFIRRMMLFDGGILGLPVTGHPLALYLRQDWLAKLKLKPPVTWDDFYQVAEAFTKKDPDGNGKPDTYGLAEHWPPADPAVGTRFLPWLYQGGGVAVARENNRWIPSFGQPAGIRALRLRRRLWEAGFIPPGAPANDAAQNMALFLGGQAGMIVEDDRWVPAVRRTLGQRAVSAPLPRDIRAGTVGDGLCFVLARRSNAKWAAFSFVRWWVSRAVQEKLILGWDGKPGGAGADSGILVAGPRTDLDPAALLGEPLYDAFARSFPTMSPEPYCPNYAALRLTLAKTASEAMAQGKTVEKALAAGMQEAAGMLQ